LKLRFAFYSFIIFILIRVLSENSFAQSIVYQNSALNIKPVEESTFEYTKRIYDELEKLKDLSPNNFSRDVDHFRGEMERFIFHKRRICNGEFSAFALVSEGKGSTEATDLNASKKLTAGEKKLCFKELKSFQVNYINNLFLARERYMEHIHQSRIKEMQTAREEALKEINRAYAWP